MEARAQQAEVAALAITSVDNTCSYNTRLAGYTLNQAKQLKNLRQDADIPDFDTVINNYDENVNMKYSRGTFLKVARPFILSLSIHPSL